jgi:hypothetical protein
MKQFDRFLDKITDGNQFIYYSEGNWFQYCSIIVTHSNCIKYNYIEEGGFVYFDVSISDWNNARMKEPYTYILAKLCSDNRLLFFKDSCFTINQQKFLKWYICDSRGLKQFPNACVLNNVFQDYYDDFFDNADAILILTQDTRREYSNNIYLKIIEDLIVNIFIKKNFKRILFRTRPHRGDAHEIMLKKFLKMIAKYPEIRFEEIPSHIIMENVFHSYNIPVYFDLSSLGFYAAMQGRKSYSTMDIFAAMDPLYRNDPNIKRILESNYFVDIVRLPAVNKDGSPIKIINFSLWYRIKYHVRNFIKRYIPRTLLFLWRKKFAQKYQSTKH